MAPRATAIIAGAGRGERAGHKEGKQFLALAGVPVLARSLLNVAAVPGIEEIVLVVNGSDVGRAAADIVAPYASGRAVRIVEGGERRQESVLYALRALSSPEGVVVVHDGARPLATPGLFRRVMKALADCDCDGIIAAVPAVDTVKEVEGGWVMRTPDRRRMWAVQTPQGFRAGALLDAHERAFREGVWATDDAALLERYRYRVRVVEGEVTNLKVTYAADMVLAEALLEKGGLQVAEPGRPGV